MLDLINLRTEIESAADSLAASLSSLWAEETKRIAQNAAREGHVKQTSDEQAPRRAARKPTGRRVREPAVRKRTEPLKNRPNVHVVPSQPAPVAHHAPITDAQPKGPSAEEIAAKVERLVSESSLPPTFERIRRSLRVTKAALAPVIDDLVGGNKICAVELGDVILYKPPRIEPIRRRRADRIAAQ